VLELPTHTIYSSQTQPGDQLLICAVEEIATRFNRAGVAPLQSQVPQFGANLDSKPPTHETHLFEANGLGRQ
jgi:hypothetical protein